jgi:hypothetical protein
VPTSGSTSEAGSLTTEWLALVGWVDAAVAVAGRIIPVTVSAAIAVVENRALWVRLKDNVVTAH